VTGCCYPLPWLKPGVPYIYNFSSDSFSHVTFAIGTSVQRNVYSCVVARLIICYVSTKPLKMDAYTLNITDLKQKTKNHRIHCDYIWSPGSITAMDVPFVRWSSRCSIRNQVPLGLRFNRLPSRVPSRIENPIIAVAWQTIFSTTGNVYTGLHIIKDGSLKRVPMRGFQITLYITSCNKKNPTYGDKMLSALHHRGINLIIAKKLRIWPYLHLFWP